MAGQGDAQTGSIVIGGRYRLLPDQPRAGYADLFSCAVEHDASLVERAQSPDLIAVRVRRAAPPPAQLHQYLHLYNAHLLMPVAHGIGGDAYWVVCDAPPGPPVLQVPSAPIGEAELVNTVLKPLAQALARLHAAGLTHRGVRAANLFRSESGRLLLGPGCLGPYAFDQPASYESPFNALCTPACRGSGAAADDVYALGVLMLELLFGRRLLPDVSDLQLVQRKLEQGSYAVLTADERIPASLVPLLRSMLSDDPQGRPTTASLAENGLGAERPKPPRPESRAARPLMIGRMPVYSARMLAQAFSRQPVEALALLRAGTIDQWLRRSLEQPLIAVRIEDTLRTGRDRSFEGREPLLLMQVIAMLDPLLPMFWHGTWLWPEGLSGHLALLASENAETAPIADLLKTRVLRRWLLLSGRVATHSVDEIERRYARISEIEPALRMPALAYALNPYLPCLSPTLPHVFALGAAQLLDALEAKGGDATEGRVLDVQMLALLAARIASDEGIAGTVADAALPDLVLLARAQRSSNRDRRDEHRQDPHSAGNEFKPALYPKLAARLLPACRDQLRTWPGKGRRARRIERLERLVETGDLPAMLSLVEQTDARAVDEQALREARGQVEALRAAHLASTEAGEERSRNAVLGGQDLGIAAGIVGLMIAVMVEIVS